MSARRFFDLEPYDSFEDAAIAAAEFPCGVAGCDGEMHEAFDAISDWEHRTLIEEHVSGFVVEICQGPHGPRYACVRMDADQVERDLSAAGLRELADQVATLADWFRSLAAQVEG